MPEIDLYQEKKPLFELCELLIRIRMLEIGIRNDIEVKLESFYPVLGTMHSMTEPEKWSKLKSLILRLASDDDPMRPDRALLQVRGLTEAFRASTDGIPNLQNRLILKYGSESMRQHHNHLQAMTRLNASRQEDRNTHYVREGNQIHLHFRLHEISIRGFDSIQAKVVRLLLGDELDTMTNEPPISIQRFSRDNEGRGTTLAPEYVAGDWINEEALVEMLFEESTGTGAERMAALRKSFRSAVQGVNEKSSVGIIIEIKDNHDERLVRINER